MTVKKMLKYPENSNRVMRGDLELLMQIVIELSAHPSLDMPKCFSINQIMSGLNIPAHDDAICLPSLPKSLSLPQKLTSI